MEQAGKIMIQQAFWIACAATQARGVCGFWKAPPPLLAESTPRAQFLPELREACFGVRPVQACVSWSRCPAGRAHTHTHTHPKMCSPGRVTWAGPRRMRQLGWGGKPPGAQDRAELAGAA